MELRIKELIHQTLEENHLSVRQMAKGIDVSHQTIYNWIEGKHLPDLGTVRKLRSIDGWQGDFAFKLSLILLAG